MTLGMRTGGPGRGVVKISHVFICHDFGRKFQMGRKRRGEFLQKSWISWWQKTSPDNTPPSRGKPSG